MKEIPDKSIHCCVTSPPYFNLRSYLPNDSLYKQNEIGQEKTPDEYINNLIEIFREVKRVLRDDSVLWINISDTYRNNQLMGIPWKLAFSLQSDGWLLIQDIIWAKNNCLPESVTRRCTRSHEYVFLFAKSKKYYYDNEAIKEPSTSSDHRIRDRETAKLNNVLGRSHMNGLKANNYATRNKRDVWHINNVPYKGSHFACFPPELIEPCIKAGTSEYGVCTQCGSPYIRVIEKTGNNKYGGYRKRADAPGAEVSQSSAFRTGLISITQTLGWEPSCSCNASIVPATIIDPFGGSGTVGQWCNQNNRNAILIELNPEYKPLIIERINSKPKSKKKKVSHVEKVTLQQNLIQYCN